MPTIPTTVKLSATGADVINAIRTSATAAYQSAVPEVVPSDVLSLHAVGNAIMGTPSLQNEFVSTLINKIAMSLISSRMWENPWKSLKIGIVEVGETVEELFVNLTKPHTFDATVAEAELYKREIPDIKSAYHTMNYKEFYKQTISKPMLKLAFVTFDGVIDLITKIVESLSKSAEYDEFLIMKYLLCQSLVNGDIDIVNVPFPDEGSANAIISIIREQSNRFQFLNKDHMIFNTIDPETQIYNDCPRDRQILMTTTYFDSIYNVVSLASAFNMDKREFVGQQILIDSFDETDNNRLTELFKNDANFEPFTQTQLASLSKVHALLMDRNFLMIFDNLIESGEVQNVQGLYWNHLLHNWKTVSRSPFSKAVAFASL